MNEGTLSRRALEATLPASRLDWRVSRGAQGELVRLVSQAWRGRHMFLGSCHHGNGSSSRVCVQGRGRGRHMEPC